MTPQVVRPQALPDYNMPCYNCLKRGVVIEDNDLEREVMSWDTFYIYSFSFSFSSFDPHMTDCLHICHTLLILYVTSHVFFRLNIVCLRGLDGIRPTSRPLCARGSAPTSALDIMLSLVFLFLSISSFEDGTPGSHIAHSCRGPVSNTTP
jgi:hypothetical protein